MKDCKKCPQGIILQKRDQFCRNPAGFSPIHQKPADNNSSVHSTYFGRNFGYMFYEYYNISTYFQNLKKIGRFRPFWLENGGKPFQLAIYNLKKKQY